MKNITTLNGVEGTIRIGTMTNKKTNTHTGIVYIPNNIKGQPWTM